MNIQAFLNGITSTEERQWGLGVVQEIDAAAMSVWLGWREYEANAFCNDSEGCLGLNAGHNDLSRMNIVKGGALINF
jgi:hypothetical protein